MIVFDLLFLAAALAAAYLAVSLVGSYARPQAIKTVGGRGASTIGA